MATAKKSTPIPSTTARKTARRTTQTAQAPAKKAPRKTTTVAAKPSVSKPKATAKVVSPTPVKPDKVKKPKLVRDSFTIPKSEFAVLEVLKLRGNKQGRPVKKSELLRAGIKALAAMSDIQFKAALAQVPAIKTGRPKASK